MPAHAQRMSSLLASDKEFAFCRRHTMGSEVQAGKPEAAGDCGARSVVRGLGRAFLYLSIYLSCRGGRNCRLGAGLGEERTQNMEFMVVTLEVSRLSG